MSTAHKKESEKQEYFDPPEELEQKIEVLAQWIRESEHFTVFTGAGISTSAGISDFRSGYNTVLPTGPGVWERRAQKKKVTKKTVSTSTIKAIPTQTHMSFVKLMQEDILKYVISQNTDGLHRRSGIPPDRIAELHGNSNLEVCTRCKSQYMRDFRVRTAQKVHDHKTGRHCDNEECKGELKDTIINFGENLDSDIINAGFREGGRSDICLAMGSSLRVTPAADIPLECARNGGKLVIVNLQKTPLNKSASMVIHALCDTVMNMVMEKLGLQIPEFRLIRRLKVSKEEYKDQEQITFSGVDVDGKPFSLFPKIKVQYAGKETQLQGKMQMRGRSFDQVAEVKVSFQGHYNEPDLPIQVDFGTIQLGKSKVFAMVYNPFQRVWEDYYIVH